MKSHLLWAFNLWTLRIGIVSNDTPQSVHWILWTRRCRYKSTADPNVIPHDSTGHLWTAVCLRKWTIIQSFRENLFSQPGWRHPKGSSPVCILSCICNTDDRRWEYFLPQWLHLSVAIFDTSVTTMWPCRLKRYLYWRLCQMIVEPLVNKRRQLKHFEFENRLMNWQGFMYTQYVLNCVIIWSRVQIQSPKSREKETETETWNLKHETAESYGALTVQSWDIGILTPNTK